MLTELKIARLDARRKALKLCFLYKIFNNPSTFPMAPLDYIDIAPIPLGLLKTTMQPKWAHCSIFKLLFSLVLLIYGII